MKKEYNLHRFLLLAFGIPLICCSFRVSCTFFQEGVGNLILLMIAATSPMLAAILTIALSSEFHIKTFLNKNYKENLSLKYSLMVFLIPAFFLTIGKIIICLATPQYAAFKMPTLKKMVIILWALVAEELGWRGYLQGALERRIGNSLAPCIVGVIWTLWHYHFWIIHGLDAPLWLFAYGCIAESYGYALITKLSRENIVPASIWHFSSNLFFNMYLINPNWNGGSIIPYLIVNGVYTFYILVFFIHKHINKHAGYKRQKYNL